MFFKVVGWKLDDDADGLIKGIIPLVGGQEGGGVQYAIRRGPHCTLHQSRTTSEYGVGEVPGITVVRRKVKPHEVYFSESTHGTWSHLLYLSRFDEEQLHRGTSEK